MLYEVITLEPDAALVVEYKTGDAAPEHEAQVRRYLGLLGAMLGKRALRGRQGRLAALRFGHGPQEFHGAVGDLAAQLV